MAAVTHQVDTQQAEAQAAQGQPGQQPAKTEERYKVFGLRIQLKRKVGVKFHEMWSHELEAALHPEAKGQVMSETTYRVYGDMDAISKALEKVSQTPTVVLSAGSTRTDKSFFTIYYEHVHGGPHDIILEVVDDLIPLGQKMLAQEAQQQAQDVALVQGQGGVQYQPHQAAQAPVQPQEAPCKVFGLKTQLTRGVRFHDSWAHELEAALHAEAQGQVLSESSYRVRGDMTAIAKALDKVAQMPSVVLSAGSTRTDKGYLTAFYEHDTETDARIIILEVVDDFIPLGQQVLTLWEPLLEKSPMPGTFAPTSSLETSET
ncbi:hypothetical protein MTO96_028457 [Rhipicephalus appendiculatus]